MFKLRENEGEKGITLIALVLTIIVLIILAGVSIAMLTGENGILTQAKKAKEETEKAQINEEIALDNYEQYINTNIGVTLETITGEETNNTITQDSLGNKIVVPAGFRVVNPKDNVEDGIVIEDVTYGETIGSQFVWIPVGEKLKKEDGTTFNITLGRYVFNKDGTINEEMSKIEPKEKLKTDNDSQTYFIEDMKEDVIVNAHAKDIEEFIEKVKLSGGYYIAKYEARTKTQRYSSGDELTKVTVIQNDFVYNYVTQKQASELSGNMYNNENFECDLVNSYAWDTAIEFLQECSGEENYSRKTSINIGNLANKGTSDDNVCNIFDMASNCYEWSTERIVYENENDSPCVLRGGIYSVNTYYSADRHGGKVTYSDIRSILSTNLIFIVRKINKI